MDYKYLYCRFLSCADHCQKTADSFAENVDGKVNYGRGTYEARAETLRYCASDLHLWAGPKERQNMIEAWDKYPENPKNKPTESPQP